MIQRIQSIWLLLAATFAAVTFKFPFYSGNRIVDTATNMIEFTPLDATTTIWLSILTAITGAVAFVNIFLFDNRKLQLKLCYLGIFLAVLLLVMYFIEIGRYTSGNISLWCVFHFAILGFYILATRGIWKDEKLIKNMDRLR